MIDHKITATVDMYLLAIFTLQSGDHPAHVPISRLAVELDLQPVSANQMVKKMAQDGWVEYFPYKGVKLTPNGEEHALRILRHRRLWEVFLVRELGLSLTDADALACELEHLISEDVADRLDEYLEHPAVCFHGDPIPQKSDGGPVMFAGFLLDEIPVGEDAQVMRIEDDAVTKQFLSREGIRPGVRVRIIAAGSDGDVLIESSGKRIHLSKDLAAAVVLG